MRRRILGILLILGVIIVFAVPGSWGVPPWLRVLALVWSIVIAFYLSFAGQN